MTPDTLSAILNTKPSREAREAANKLFSDYKLSAPLIVAAVVQHASDVAKKACVYAGLHSNKVYPQTIAEKRIVELLDSLILSEPKDRLDDALVEAMRKQGWLFSDHMTRMELAADFRTALAKHGGKIVWEGE